MVRGIWYKKVLGVGQSSKSGHNMSNVVEKVMGIFRTVYEKGSVFFVVVTLGAVEEKTVCTYAQDTPGCLQNRFVKHMLDDDDVEKLVMAVNTDEA